MIAYLKERPLVSVIVATHNRADLLPVAIQSLINQTMPDFEILIVDDASEDATPQVIQDLCKSDARIKAIRSPKNIGPGAARNLGISQSRAEYIAVIDDDDMAMPQRLAVQVDLLENDRTIGLCFSTYKALDDARGCIGIHPELVNRGEFPENPADVFKLLYIDLNIPIPNTTIMFRRNLWEEFRYPDYPWVWEDWFLFTTMASAGMKFVAIPEPLVKKTVGISREGLSAASAVHDPNRRMLLVKMVRKWMMNRGIQAPANYHRMALSNAYFRERLYSSPAKRWWLLLIAFFIFPANPIVWEKIGQYQKRLAQKITA